MSLTSSALTTTMPSRPWSVRLQGAGRLAALLVAFAAVTYMTMYTVFLVPDFGFDERWVQGWAVVEVVQAGHLVASLL